MGEKLEMAGIVLVAALIVATASIGLYFFSKDDSTTRGKKSNKNAQIFLITMIIATMGVSAFRGFKLHEKLGVQNPIIFK
jgi:hypothetical protein